jgi:hypothetical protein
MGCPGKCGSRHDDTVFEIRNGPNWVQSAPAVCLEVSGDGNRQRAGAAKNATQIRGLGN